MKRVVVISSDALQDSRFILVHPRVIELKTAAS